VSNLQKRGNYSPRRVREQRAYRLLVVGGVSGAAGVIGLVLAAVGTIGAGVPLILLVLAAVCAVMFRGLTTKR
jgi:hypothetical protein